ncbi:hypothetical protein [Paenibacillus glacialis]|uniref:Uncharacterized protein n=1 Tax=Paenibacillus glacialis TaxID=494026 RepID=A0A168KEH1_9BACL|nr:hypothetical protein [Paenibacillus glacialis]OAB41904.1 hypothetical protein PGLA_15030 [Paenibacillus glacialis]
MIEERKENWDEDTPVVLTFQDLLRLQRTDRELCRDGVRLEPWFLMILMLAEIKKEPDKLSQVLLYCI